ncbi:MAG: hypothetical protein KF861_13325 [Planctomycetaceae bacterium]|nr:hypothetical protein [Planctomycetaceae bacterium]
MTEFADEAEEYAIERYVCFIRQIVEFVNKFDLHLPFKDCWIVVNMSSPLQRDSLLTRGVPTILRI